MTSPIDPNMLEVSRGRSASVDDIQKASLTPASQLRSRSNSLGSQNINPGTTPLLNRNAQQAMSHKDFLTITQEELKNYTLTKTEYKAVTSISFMGGNINNINPNIIELPKGFLEKFPNLKSLNLAGTNISILLKDDLKALSKLESLNLAGTLIINIPIDGLKSLPLTYLNLAVRDRLKANFSLKDLESLFYTSKTEQNNLNQQPHQKDSELHLTLNQHSAKALDYSENLGSLKTFHINLPDGHSVTDAKTTGEIIALLNLNPEAKDQILANLSEGRPAENVITQYCEKNGFTSVNILLHPENSQKNWDALPNLDFLSDSKDGDKNADKIHNSKKFYEQTGLWPTEYKKILQTLNLDRSPSPADIFTTPYKKNFDAFQEGGEVALKDITNLQLQFLLTANKNQLAIKKLTINNERNINLSMLPDLRQYNELKSLSLNTPAIKKIDETHLPSSLRELNISSIQFNNLNGLKYVKKIIIQNEEPEFDIDKFLNNNIPLPMGLILVENINNKKTRTFSNLREIQLKNAMQGDPPINAIHTYLNSQEFKPLPEALKNETIFAIYPDLKAKADSFNAFVTKHSKAVLKFDADQSPEEITKILKHIDQTKVTALYLDNISNLTKIPDLTQFKNIEILHVSAKQDLSAISADILKNIKSFKIKIDDQADFKQVEAFMKSLTPDLLQGGKSFNLMISKKGFMPKSIPLTASNYNRISLFVSCMNLMPPLSGVSKLDLFLNYKKDWKLEDFKNHQSPEAITGFKNQSDFIKALQENKKLQSHLQSINQNKIFTDHYRSALTNRPLDGLNDAQSDFLNIYQAFYRITPLEQGVAPPGKQQKQIPMTAEQARNKNPIFSYPNQQLDQASSSNSGKKNLISPPVEKRIVNYKPSPLSTSPTPHSFMPRSLFFTSLLNQSASSSAIMNTFNPFFSPSILPFGAALLLGTGIKNSPIDSIVPTTIEIPQWDLDELNNFIQSINLNNSYDALAAKGKEPEQKGLLERASNAIGLWMYSILITPNSDTEFQFNNSLLQKIQNQQFKTVLKNLPPIPNQEFSNNPPVQLPLTAETANQNIQKNLTFGQRFLETWESTPALTKKAIYNLYDPAGS